MSRRRNQARSRRRRLFREHPFCTYCECKLRETVNTPDAATLEHVISRNHPLRGKIEGRTFLACKQCNNERQAAEQRAMPIEELWRRAGHLERMVHGVPSKEQTDD